MITHEIRNLTIEEMKKELLPYEWTQDQFGISFNYLDDNGFSNWARYIEKRITINNTYTKEIIEWQ